MALYLETLTLGAARAAARQRARARLAAEQTEPDSQEKKTDDEDLDRSLRKERLERKLQREVDAVLWRAFREIVEDGRVAAKRGRLVRRQFEDAEHAERVKQRRTLSAARLAAVEAARRHEMILGLAEDESHTLRAGGIQKGATTNKNETFHKSVLDFDDAEWAVKILDARQKTVEVIFRAVRQTCDRPVHHGVFNDVLFKSDLAASLRRRGVDATLDEIDALWRDVVDDLRVRRENNNGDNTQMIRGGGSSFATTSLSAPFSLNESVDVLKGIDDLRYELLAVEDFARWMRKHHPLLREDTDDAREKLHLLGRVAPTALLRQQFQYWDPIVTKLDRLRLLNAVAGRAGGLPLVVALNTACVDTCHHAPVLPPAGACCGGGPEASSASCCGPSSST